MRKPDRKAKRGGIRRGTEDRETTANGEPPDYEQWLNKPCWYVNEICCLAKGFDPIHVSGGVVVDLDSGEVEPAPKNYRAIVTVAKVSEMVRRAIESGELEPTKSGGNCFKPLTVITYLNQKGIVLPSELLTVLPQSVAPGKKEFPSESTDVKVQDADYANEDVLEASKESKPWLIHCKDDPKPEQPWYTPARYFARQLVVEDSTLLTKRNLLAKKISVSLKGAGIYKRGGKKPFNPDTIKKALSNIKLG